MMRKDGGIFFFLNDAHTDLPSYTSTVSLKYDIMSNASSGVKKSNINSLQQSTFALFAVIAI